MRRGRDVRQMPASIGDVSANINIETTHQHQDPSAAED
jgi:hypothetical protein